MTGHGQGTPESKEQRIKAQVCLECSLLVLLLTILHVLVSQASGSQLPLSLGVHSLPLFFLVVHFPGRITPGHLSNKIHRARLGGRSRK